MSVVDINNPVGHDDMSSLEVYELLKKNLSECRSNLLMNLQEINGKLTDVHNKYRDIKSLQEEKRTITDALARFDKFENHLSKIKEYEDEIKRSGDEESIYKISDDIIKEQILLRIMFYAGCDDVLSLENGHRKLNEDGKVGVAAPDGKVIIPTEYDDVLPLKNGHRKLKKDGKAGVAAPDGKVIIPTEYDGESFFDMKNGNLPYVEKRLRGIMSVAGVLHKAEYSSYPNLLDNGYAVVENYSDITHNTKGLLDDKGNLVIPLSFSMITLDPDGLVSVRYCVNDKESHGTLQLYGGRLVTVYESIKEKYGKYTLHGDKIIPCVCDSILEDTGSKGTYIVRIGRGDCLIKNDGSVIFDSNEYFKSRKNFRHETYNINKFIESGKGEPKIATISICRGENVSYGLINEKGEVLIYPKYASELQYHDKDLYLTTKKEGSRLWGKIIEIYVSCLDGKEYIKN